MEKTAGLHFQKCKTILQFTEITSVMAEYVESANKIAFNIQIIFLNNIKISQITIIFTNIKIVKLFSIKLKIC